MTHTISQQPFEVHVQNTENTRDLRIHIVANTHMNSSGFKNPHYIWMNVSIVVKPAEAKFLKFPLTLDHRQLCVSNVFMETCDPSVYYSWKSFPFSPLSLMFLLCCLSVLAVHS